MIAPVSCNLIIDMKSWKRTILFTNIDDLEKTYVIDEEIDFKFVPKFNIVEYVAGIKTRVFNHFIVDQNQESISLEEFKKRKLELGYLELPNQDWYYKEGLGGVRKTSTKIIGSGTYRHSVKHYTRIFETTLYIEFIGDEIDDFSFKNYLHFKENESTYRELILDAILQDV